MDSNIIRNVSKIGRYDFTLSNSDRANLAGIPLSRLLTVRREGKAMPYEPVSYNTGTQEMTLYSFQRLSEKVYTPFPSNAYIQKILDLSIGGTRNQYFEIGLAIHPAGRRFKMTGGLLGDVQYDTELGDTYADVMAGLSSQLTGLGYTITFSTNVLIVTMSPSDSITASLTMADATLYQSGLLTVLTYELYGDTYTKEYLIEVNESTVDYPALPTPASSYALDDLTYAGTYGVNQYLYDPLYYYLEYSTEEIGPVDITGIPGTAIVEAGKAYIDEENDLIIFGQSTEDTVEYFQILYKRN